MPFSFSLFFFILPRPQLTKREKNEKTKKNFHPLSPSKQVRAGPRDAKEEWEKRLKEVKRKGGRDGASVRRRVVFSLPFSL